MADDSSRAVIPTLVRSFVKAAKSQVVFYSFYKTVRIKGIAQLFHNRWLYDTHVFIIPKKTGLFFFLK